MWKTDLLSLFRAHRASAGILIVLAALSSTIVVRLDISQQSLSCNFNTGPFPATSSMFWNVFYIANPGEAKICLTVQFSGKPSGGLSLAPSLDLYSHGQSSYSWLDCSADGANCGETTVSSTPERDVLPDLPIHVMWTIETSEASKPGDYLLQFGLCRGGGFIGIQIGSSNHTLQHIAPESLCPIILWGVKVTFDGYTGLVPTNQDWPIPLPLLS